MARCSNPKCESRLKDGVLILERESEADLIEAALRASWTAKGIPKARQDEIIREVEEKAKPGAQIGPWVIGG